MLDIKKYDSVKIEGFSKNFGKVVLFDNVNLTLDDSGIYLIFGLNGAGKTTFFKCLSNLDEYRGIINLNDNNDIFCIFDDNPLYLNISGFENIKVLANQAIDKNRLDTIAEKYFAELDSFYKKKTKKLSLGQRKMITLILLEYLQPRFILLDEIFNGLDIFSRKKVIRLLSDIKENTFILLSGHEKLYIDISDNFLYINDKNIKKVDRTFLYQLVSSVLDIEGDKEFEGIN